jgi:hypothetical protein
MFSLCVTSAQEGFHGVRRSPATMSRTCPGMPFCVRSTVPCCGSGWTPATPRWFRRTVPVADAGMGRCSGRYGRQGVFLRLKGAKKSDGSGQRMKRRKWRRKRRFVWDGEEAVLPPKESLNKATSAPQGASQSLMRPESRESERSLFRAFLKVTFRESALALLSPGNRNRALDQEKSASVRSRGFLPRCFRR